MNSDDSRKKASFTYNASPTWGEQKDSANQIRINKTMDVSFLIAQNNFKSKV
jgi:hypothetical protein